MAAPKGNKFAVGNEGGQPKAIESPDILWSLFEDYKQHTKAHPRLEHDYVGKDAVSVERRKEVPLTMDRFECWLADLGIINQIGHYFSNREGRYEEFVDVCQRIRKEIRADQIEGGMCNLYNPSITQRLNGLVDKQEVTNQEAPEIDYTKLSDAALAEITALKSRSGTGGAL